MLCRVHVKRLFWRFDQRVSANPSGWPRTNASWAPVPAAVCARAAAPVARYVIADDAEDDEHARADERDVARETAHLRRPEERREQDECPVTGLDVQEDRRRHDDERDVPFSQHRVTGSPQDQRA